MKYTFAYRTPDGVRHEDAMEASSREEVFSALRERGIRAIKVVAADGSKANGEVVVRGIRKCVAIVAVVGAAAVAGLSSYFLIPRAEQSPDVQTVPIEFTTDSARIAYTNLETKAATIIKAHAERIEALKFDQLSDYALIERTSETSELSDKVKAGYKAVDASRAEIRDLFKSIFTIFPDDCKTERAEAQRLYARTMDALDLSERRIVNDEKAFNLLNANRGKWRTANGNVEWSDAVLANEFEYFRRDVSPASTRRRNGANVIESPVIEVHFDK